jgi:hypothetical protein
MRGKKDRTREQEKVVGKEQKRKGQTVNGKGRENK